MIVDLDVDSLEEGMEVCHRSIAVVVEEEEEGSNSEWLWEEGRSLDDEVGGGKES